MKKNKVIVGLSGGVDSAVSALLLKQQGYDVTGVFMQNWETGNDDPFCSAQQDLSDARAVCDILQIPFLTVNFSKQYWNNVFQHCLNEFSLGRTPNPDIGCNKEIKFKVFLEHALQLGADYIATGHYVRSQKINDQYEILKAFDNNKDQSYFLYTLGQGALSRTLFPVGEMPKPKVREIAKQAGLYNYNKKDSTGICFIGERKFKDFLSEFLLTKPGPIETTEGKVLGKHDGLMYYTIGQRKGLNMGGKKDAKQAPWYVIDKDIKRNILIISQGHDHPLLFSSSLICDDLHWIKEEPPKTLPMHCVAKTRYRQSDQACTITSLDGNRYNVQFSNPQRAITPGQSIVFYQDDVCLGGGIIKERSL